MRIFVVLLWGGLLLLMSCGSNKSLLGAAANEERAAILAMTNNLEQLGRIMPGIYSNTKQYNEVV